MIATVQEFRSRLLELDPYADELVLQTDQLVQALSPSIASSVYTAVFEFFESAPDADCGAPGTLVHHVEHYYPNYVGALKDSVRRKPSLNGVLMINRILNDAIQREERQELMHILRTVAEDDSIDSTVSENAERFFKRRERIDSEPQDRSK